MNKFRLYFQATAIGFVLLFAGVLALPLNNVEAKYPPNFIPCDHDISNQPVHITVGTDPTFGNVYRLSWYLYDRNNHLIRDSATYNFHMCTTHETIEYYESNDDKCVAKISAHITTSSGYQTGATWAIPWQGGGDENKHIVRCNFEILAGGSQGIRVSEYSCETKTQPGGRNGVT